MDAPIILPGLRTGQGTEGPTLSELSLLEHVGRSSHAYSRVQKSPPLWIWAVIGAGALLAVLLGLAVLLFGQH